MNVAICDDNMEDIEKIRTLLIEHFDKNGYTGEVDTFTNGEALLDAFSIRQFDVVFLDIYMTGMDGMKTARKLREIDPHFILVFISISRDHAMESYSLCANSYVPKPIQRADMDKAFRQCQNMFLKNARFVEVMSDRRKIKIPLIKILYIETYGRETLFHTTDREIRTTASMPLDNLLKTLGNAFLRCHRSYVVNLNHVNAIQPNDFQMRDGSLVPLRQRGRAELRNAYGNFISDRLFEVPS